MSPRDNDVRVRPGRIRDSGRGLSRPKSFVGQVMRPQRRPDMSAIALDAARAVLAGPASVGAGVLRSRCRCDRPRDVW